MSFTLPRGFALLRERRSYSMERDAWYTWLLSGQPQRWQDGVLLALAKRIEQAGNFYILPILADALEEAGCPYTAAIAHCRIPHEGLGKLLAGHYLDCWVVDDLLEAAEDNCDPDDIVCECSR